MAHNVPEGDTSVQLHTWAMKEMNFHPKAAFSGSSIPSPDDFKRFSLFLFLIYKLIYIVDS